MTSLNQWLKKSVMPLWLEKGVDSKSGGFIEALSFEGQPLDIPRRAMVQARQIYSWKLAYELSAVDEARAKSIILKATRYLTDNFSLSSGAFIHSISPSGKPENKTSDLYAQAFALFGLANSFAVNPDAKVEERAKALVRYLKSERSLPQGGFSELASSGVMYEANPHMHLFEATIAWLNVSDENIWQELAEQILSLCLNKFVDSKSGALCEHFDEDWKPIISERGYIVEPGHQYEWAWLMSKYEKITGTKLESVRKKLFDLSEAHGVCKDRGVVFDEVWSDMTPKAQTSRFWTQCERIKCAADGALQFSSSRQKYQQAAEAGVLALARYFETPLPGLWFDRMTESGQFIAENAKASSLYHIIGAISEFESLQRASR